ncbi:hypothetical protein JCM10207_008597 [Rhodosporidiobolus poonsookiae]
MSTTPSGPAALPSQLAHLTTLLLLSRAATQATASPAQPGFTHARTLPLHTLTHLLTAYLHLVASTAVNSANHAGRTGVALWDVADALGQLGFAGRAGIEELKEEARRGQDGVEEEAEQLRELAKGLQDHLAPSPLQPPIAQLSYDPLAPSELSLLELVASLPSDSAPTPSASSSLSDSDDSDSLASPPPSSSAAPEAAVKPEPQDSLAAANGLNGFAPSGLESDFGLPLGSLGANPSADAAFFDSLGLGASAPMNGVGDLPVSIFQPLDLAGRPMEGMELLGPASASGVNGFPAAFGGLAALQAAEDEEEDARPFPAWRDPAQVPDFVPPFFPPFPGMERESDTALARRRRRERERERDREAQLAAASAQAGTATVGRAAAALMLGGGAGGDPWEEAIPYSASSLATMAVEFPNSLPTPSSPHAKKKELPNGAGGEGENGAAGEGEQEKSKKKRKRRRSLSPPPATSTSLASFAQIHPLIPHQPVLMRANQLRRTAASYISHSPRHPELAVSSDSLFGSLPYAQPLRQATLPPGFLPDFAPPLIHPFNTNLPYTISNPVPYHPSSPYAHLPAAPPNPRIPAPLSSIARELSFPLQFDQRPSHKDQLHPNIALFARLRRIGPPAPLGPKGESLNYEYIGQTALVQLSGVEWPERRHNAKLPKRFGDDDESASKAQGGIKLKLGGGAAGRDGRQTREGSLAVGTPWGGAGSPAASLAGFGATPGPSGLGASTSTAVGPGPSELDSFDFTSLGLPASPAAVFQPTTSTPLPSSSLSHSTPAPAPADVDPSFAYPDFLLSATGGLGALTASLDSASVAGFDWAGLGLDGLGDSAPAPAVTAEGGDAPAPAPAGDAAPDAPALAPEATPAPEPAPVDPVLQAVESGGMEVDAAAVEQGMGVDAQEQAPAAGGA